MNNRKIIKELADPILKQLEEIEKQLQGQTLQIPEIKLLFESKEKPMYVNDIEITEEILQELEQYLQDELEMMHSLSVLH